MRKLITSFLLVSNLSFAVDKIVLVGDSLVKASGKNKGWGEFFSNETINSRVRVVNRGRAGRSTREFISEGLWKQALSERPDVIMIEFAHNEDDDGGVKVFKSNIKRMIVDAKKIKSDVVLVSPPHRYRFKNGKITNELSAYAKTMQSLSKEYKVAFIDLYDITGDRFNSWGPSKTKKLFQDGTHFNSTGAKTVAAWIADRARSVPALSTYIK